ncbi:MAG: bifunctional glutamate N-acetyltransferase/amino-acid acetyltransferase ArgJ [Syntrophales bacterium]|jgi:glutamate N-acetyltransferase/amino-acid N-acetyltransferase|nr:bifunctional glutamate N-acetyltransferase/amino-acid acetyltransferase ArgJ [Syntrophales bacterium]MCK9390928.1 bifunctional glutamate N-acetyltransferase/amino-acid acetyltransferase ArgJ [Syntrophales bacterium]
MENENICVPGFLASGVSAGIKETGAKDLSLIYSTNPARAAGVFTTNAFKAAPVLVSMERIKAGRAQAILTNSGNANAATGAAGYQDALDMSKSLSSFMKIKDDHVLVASTGVIGHRLPVEKIRKNIPAAVKGLRPDGIPEAEAAIMTTDRFPKIAYQKRFIADREISICGIAKGAGMIQPDMATMLSYAMTDADIDDDALGKAFRFAVERTFNAASVDGCMSTNDTAIILANGCAGNRMIRVGSLSFRIFRDMVCEILMKLAKDMVRDGEGATKAIEIVITGARTRGEAKKMAYAIANSNLVKTAFFGGDPNWGRIIAAAGAIGIPLPVDQVQLFFEDVPVFQHGRGMDSNLPSLKTIMDRGEIRIVLKAGMGTKDWRIFTSDLGFEYVKINAHYHT